LRVDSWRTAEAVNCLPADLDKADLGASLIACKSGSGQLGSQEDSDLDYWRTAGFSIPLSRPKFQESSTLADLAYGKKHACADLA